MTDTAQLLEQAQNCRRQALAYVGNPEAQFLFKVAAAFEDLACTGTGASPCFTKISSCKKPA